MLSVLDLFRVGIGPSSSHTVGPIRIAKRFVDSLERARALSATQRIIVELQGSLALTGAGHATPKAVILGLAGLEPETLDPAHADHIVAGDEDKPRHGAEAAFARLVTEHMLGKQAARDDQNY